MKPVAAVLVVLCLVVAIGVFAWRGGGPEIVISDATLVPMGQGFAVTVSIENPGPPDVIEAVTVQETPAILTASAPLIVPGGDSASLAMDGVHPMAMGISGDEGALVPIAVTFRDGGVVQTRARIVGAMAMDHSAVFNVPAGEPQPALAATIEQDGGLWRIALDTENFTFSEDAVDGAHMPGVGHAHLYLNGLKLGRLYSPTAEIGALPPGTHAVEVVLNTNDHQGYAVDGAPVAVTLTVTVD